MKKVYQEFLTKRRFKKLNIYCKIKTTQLDILHTCFIKLIYLSNAQKGQSRYFFCFALSISFSFWMRGKGISLKNFVACIFIFTLGLNFNVVHKVRTEIYSVSLKSIESFDSNTELTSVALFCLRVKTFISKYKLNHCLMTCILYFCH